MAEVKTFFEENGCHLAREVRSDESLRLMGADFARSESVCKAVLRGCNYRTSRDRPDVEAQDIRQLDS